MLSKYLIERNLDDLRRYLNRQGNADKYLLVLDEVEELLEKQEDELKPCRSTIDELNVDNRECYKENDDLDNENDRLRHRIDDLKERLKIAEKLSDE